MIVRRALLGAIIDMPEDAKTEFRVFIKDLAVGTVIGQVLGDEIRVGTGLLHQLANLLAAVRTGIGGKGAVTVGRELFESISHQLIPLSDIGNRIAEVTQSMLDGNGRQVRGGPSSPCLGHVAGFNRSSAMAGSANRPAHASCQRPSLRIDFVATD
jgi:hypothetical protein